MTQAVTVTTAEREEYLITEMGRKRTRGSGGAGGGESGIPGPVEASGTRSSLVSPGSFDFFNKISS